MEVMKHTISPAETKEYLSKNGIPQLFECLMTGLMYHRPTDYLNYLQECLEKVKRKGVTAVRWDLFLENRTSPPPPVVTKRALNSMSSYVPMSGIDSLKVRIRPNASIICVLGGPGVNKSSYSRGLINHYPTFVHISMGQLLRCRAKLEFERKGSKWTKSVEQINAGELLPQEMVIESLIWHLNQHADASGFIIDGFPRTQQQYEEFKAHINLENLACVFLIDATEEYCQQQLVERGQSDDYWKDYLPAAITNRICMFKLQTLPMCKAIDVDGKLRVVDGEIKPEHIARDMRTVCEYVLSGKVTGPSSKPTPGSVPDRPMTKIGHGMVGCPGQPPVFNIPRITPAFADNGRVEGLPTCPIILLFGGPGSGRSEQARALCEKLPGLKHFNVTEFLRNRVLDHIEGDSQKDWDVVARRVHSSDPPMPKDRIIPEYWNVQVDILRQEFNTVAENTKAVVIEGFPNDETQLNIFNQHIGGADLAILLDCEENTLQKRLLKRYTRLSRTEDEETVALHRILFFKHCTLPVIRHYDERSTLVTIPADRDQELVLNDVVTVVEYFLGKQECQNNNSAVTVPTHELQPLNGEIKSPNGVVGDHPSEPVVIFVVGDPGSGKTTQARKLAEHFGYNYCPYKVIEYESGSVKPFLWKHFYENGNFLKGLVVDELPFATNEGLTVERELSSGMVLMLTRPEELPQGSEGSNDAQKNEPNQDTSIASDIQQSPNKVKIFKVQISPNPEDTFQNILSQLGGCLPDGTPARDV
ncbi:Adenylate kinase isoenzyme 5 [Clonorchis sinensis]|uniref:Adenylate kinase isoenzyme 5 n=1 Tax=Clonorchis sinensis TaxID=79923 RepID=A0A3R7JNZ7_CLOSI|nr:Adenylate kinase isoenzyme 5 [Clonorchis sinensis]